MPEETTGEPQQVVNELSDLFDAGYNQAIDHAIGVAAKFLAYVPGLSEPLIVKLTELKKKA